MRYRRRQNLVLHAFGNTARRDVMCPLPVNKYAQCLLTRSWKERTMYSFLSRHLNTYIITSLIIPRNFPINILPDILLPFSSKSSRFSHAYNNGLILKIYIYDVLKFFVVFVYHISLLRARLRHCFEKQTVCKSTQNAWIWRATWASCAFCPLDISSYG